MNEVYHKYGGIIGGIIGVFILWANDKIVINLKQALACLLITVFLIIFVMMPYAETHEWSKWLEALCGLGIGTASQAAILTIPGIAAKTVQKTLKIVSSIIITRIDTQTKDEENNT